MNRRSLLGWLAAGASLTGRPGRVESPWLSEDSVSNVKDFGAVGDAVRDDGPAIQRAVDASREGKPVLLPAGRYRIRKPVVVHDETVMLGYGRHSVLYCTERDCDVVLCDGAKRVFFEGLALDGDGSNRDGLVIHAADDVRVRRCWIKSMGKRGVTIYNSPCVIMDTTVELNGAEGIFVTATNSGDPLHLVACYVFKNGGHGVHFTLNANQAMVMGSEIVLNAGAGIRIDTASKMISIVGNSILGSGASGIDIEGDSPWNSIVSNVLAESGFSGVSLRANANATVLTANRFIDNCKKGSEAHAELLVRESKETVLMANIFVRSLHPDPTTPAILSDPGSFATSLGNVFHGLAAGS